MSDFKVGDLVVLDEEWSASWYVKKYGLGIVIETTERKAEAFCRALLQIEKTT